MTFCPHRTAFAANHFPNCTAVCFDRATEEGCKRIGGYFIDRIASRECDEEIV